MQKLKFLVSLMTDENDFQIEQAESAQQAAKKLDIDVEIIYAENDAITQSTQILKSIQVSPKSRPSAIVFEPVGGTGLPQVARAALHAGIAWAVLNRNPSYVGELRLGSKVPIFSLSSDQTEVGRISGRQCAALMPRGGSILYIEGPTQSEAARERTFGMQETKPASIHVTSVKGQWTEESAQRAVRSWLKLSTSQKATIDAIVSQNDAMAIGARKAFQELPTEFERERWLTLPFLGCDGVPSTGQAWVRSGLLTATIFTPPNTGRAMEMLVDALVRHKALPEHAFMEVSSIPPIENLHAAK